MADYSNRQVICVDRGSRSFLVLLPFLVATMRILILIFWMRNVQNFFLKVSRCHDFRVPFFALQVM